MKLIECYIQNFGMLSEYTYKFTDGVNTVLAENGQGKTTLSVFIKAMLYGIGEKRKHSLDENDRKKYMPWQGGSFGGYLTFEYGGRVMRVERSFGAKASDDTVRVLSRETGEELTLYTEGLGEKLFGIDRDGFEETVFLSERNLAVGEGGSTTVQQKLSDVVGADGATDAYDKAKKRLEDDARKLKKRGGAGEIADMESLIRDATAVLDDLLRDMETVKKKEEELKELDAAILEKVEERRRAELSYEEERAKSQRRVFVSQYKARLSKIADAEAILTEKAEFFKVGGTSRDELETVIGYEREARQIRDELASDENKEYQELIRYFARQTSHTEIAAYESKMDALLKARESARLISGKRELEDSAIAAEFGGKAPTIEEVRAARETISKSSGSTLLLIVAIISAIGSIVFSILGFMGSTLMLGFGAGDLLLTIGAIFLYVKTKKASGVDRVKKTLGVGTADEIDKLEERIAQYNEAQERDAREIERLTIEADRLARELNEFISAYGLSALEYRDALTEIKARYDEFYDLSTREKLKSENAKNAALRLSFLLDSVKTYIGKYKTESTSPLAEIKTRLGEYEELARSLEYTRSECESFRLENAILPEEVELSESRDRSEEFRTVILNCDEELKEMREKRALLIEELNTLDEEISRYDEVKAAREAYARKKARLEWEYSILNQTKALLEEATNNMTDRYLGKTRERFDYYTSLIGGGGDFTIDTKFVMQKIDKGASREIDSYSRGTKDLYRLALRLALVDSLYDTDLPPIILDDPFIAFDDVKLERAKEMIRKVGEKRQIIYMTCSSARAI